MVFILTSEAPAHVREMQTWRVFISTEPVAWWVQLPSGQRRRMTPLEVRRYRYMLINHWRANPSRSLVRAA